MLGVRSRSQDHLISTLAGLWHPQSLSGWWVTGSTWINLFILKKYSQHLQSAELYAIDTKWTRRTSEYWDCLNRHARTIKCHVRHIQKMMQSINSESQKAWTSGTSGRRWLGKMPLGADSWAQCWLSAGNPPSVMYGYYPHLAFQNRSLHFSETLFSEFWAQNRGWE